MCGTTYPPSWLWLRLGWVQNRPACFESAHSIHYATVSRVSDPVIMSNKKICLSLLRVSRDQHFLPIPSKNEIFGRKLWQRFFKRRRCNQTIRKLRSKSQQKSLTSYLHNFHLFSFILIEWLISYWSQTVWGEWRTALPDFEEKKVAQFTPHGCKSCQISRRFWPLN